MGCPKLEMETDLFAELQRMSADDFARLAGRMHVFDSLRAIAAPRRSPDCGRSIRGWHRAPWPCPTLITTQRSSLIAGASFPASNRPVTGSWPTSPSG
jgi:hypothetical protein